MAIRTRPVRRRKAADEQLSLPIAWLSEGQFLRALRRRGVKRITRVHFKNNRSRLISLGSDRVSVNIHACFQAATAEVLDAVAAFIRARAGTTEYRMAVQRMRAWWDGQTAGGLYAGGNGRRRASKPPPSAGTEEQGEYLRKLYRELNRRRFQNRLPERLPLRLSDRMRRRFGHVQYSQKRNGERVVAELALNIDLLIPGNERHLVDTLLHEMAHVEAWLRHAHRDHGEAWRRIAERVGCDARACSNVRIRHRRANKGRVTQVPDLPVAALLGPARRRPGRRS